MRINLKPLRFLAKKDLFRNKRFLALIISALIILATIGTTYTAFLGQVAKVPAERVELEDLLISCSERKLPATMTVVSEDSPYYPLLATPIVAYYENTKKFSNPLLIGDGNGVTKFLSLYQPSPIVTIGNLKGINSASNVNGNLKEISIDMMENFWERTDGAILIEDVSPESNDSYPIFSLAIQAVPLASYLNIPVVVTDKVDKEIINTLSKLSVKYTLICGNLKGYGKVLKFKSVEEIQNLTLDFMKERFGSFSYITLTNPRDINAEYGIPSLSILAPYLAASHQGIVLSCLYERLPDDIFDVFDDSGNLPVQAMTVANKLAENIKTDFKLLLNITTEKNLLSGYLEERPYLGILADPYSVPFNYAIIGGGTNPSGEPTDNFYSNVDDDEELELASGRPMGSSLQTTSALIARTLFYEEYMPSWVANSLKANLQSINWKDSAYVGLVDTTASVLKTQYPIYYETMSFLKKHSYDVYSTTNRAAYSVISEETLKYYSSSSYVWVFAHGNYNIYLGTESQQVKTWDLGPSVITPVACLTGKTDVPDIENAISLAFIDSGFNVFIGEMRIGYAVMPSVINTDEATAGVVKRIYTNMIERDQPIGIALRDAKNDVIINSEQSSTLYCGAIVELYGDPAFNPYQP